MKKRRYNNALKHSPANQHKIHENSGCVTASHKKKYDVVYVCRDGRYQKIKVPHGYEVGDTISHIFPVQETEPLTKKQRKAKDKAALKARKADLKLKASKWKHHADDRIEGRKLRSSSGMLRFMAYIMPQRCDALNTYADSFDITETERFCRQKVKSGMTGFGILHVLLASYVRTISQRPGINRFINGQEIFSRYSIDVVMTVKKNMTVESPDTCVKVHFEPTDTIYDVYKKFNSVVQSSIGDNADTAFDSISGIMKYIPRPLLRFFVWLINKLDYHGHLPFSLLEVSPFHGSMIITSMGSLGIKPIYHHIYNFGNLPVFLSYGKTKVKTSIDVHGNQVKRKTIDMKVVTDERICDGFYYASAFKLMKKYVENPSLLEEPPQEVFDDIE